MDKELLKECTIAGADTLPLMRNLKAVLEDEPDNKLEVSEAMDNLLINLGKLQICADKIPIKWTSQKILKNRISDAIEDLNNFIFFY